MKCKTLNKRVASNIISLSDVDVAASGETFHRRGVFAIHNLATGSWCEYEPHIMRISCRRSNAGNICLRRQERSCAEFKQTRVAVEMSSMALIEWGMQS